MQVINFILNLDRRIIYTVVALLVIAPLVKPLSLPVIPTTEVHGIFDRLEALPAGSPVIIGADFDPASKPELLPMLHAVLAHCFARELKPVILTLWPAGPRLMQTAIEFQAAKFGKQSGSDYCYLGYRPGTGVVIIGLTNSVTGTFGLDYYGQPTANMEIFRQANKLSDFSYIVEIAAGASVEQWINYGAEPANVPIGASCTAVSATQYYPYLQAGQLTGLAGGMKGSAEYEKLLMDKYGAEHNIPTGAATKGMDAQSIVHFFIVFSIVIANIGYFVSRRNERQARRRS